MFSVKIPLLSRRAREIYAVWPLMLWHVLECKYRGWVEIASPPCRVQDAHPRPKIPQCYEKMQISFLRSSPRRKGEIREKARQLQLLSAFCTSSVSFLFFGGAGPGRGIRISLVVWGILGLGTFCTCKAMRRSQGLFFFDIVYVFFLPPRFCQRVPAFWTQNLGLKSVNLG